MLNQITEQYGFIKRAKDHYLYTSKGTRLVDMYQQGGAAILGWRAGSAKLAFKNQLDRGLTGSYPHPATAGLERAVQKLIPGSIARIYATQEEASLALESWTTSTWRPWLPNGIRSPQQDQISPTGSDPQKFQKSQKSHNLPKSAYILCAPYPFTPAPIIVAFMQSAPQPTALPATDQPAAQPAPSSPIAPPLLAAITRAIYDLIKEIPLRTEADFALFDPYLSPYFMRIGAYLYPKCSETDYPTFFTQCLTSSVLISPDYATPSIIPFTADLGTLRKFNKEMPPIWNITQ